MSIELNNDQIMANYALESWWKSGTKKQVFEISGGAGVGKALTNDTRIPTPDGYKLIGEIKEGDYVFDRLGRPTEVLGVYPQGKRKCYRVHINDGREVICSKDHLFTTIEVGGSKVLSVGQMQEGLESGKILGYTIWNNAPVNYKYKGFDYKPEYLGREIIVINNINIENDIDDPDLYRYIPEEYMLGSYKERKSLLEGLMFYGEEEKKDLEISGHSIPCKMSSLILGNYKLAEQIRELLYSLGIHRVFIKQEGNVYDNIWILSFIEFNEDIFCSIDSIEELNYEKEMTCLYVDNDEHLFLCNDYVVTHNTTLIMYFIDRIGLPLNNVLFTSFTGKAVNVMQRHGLPAKTIHSSIYDYVKKEERDENGNLVLTKNGRVKMKGEFELKDHLPKKIKLIVVDEASMVTEQLALDLLSFGVPVVALGDLNQLPPVMGKPYFLKEPDVILHQIMRQAEGNPIIWLSQQVLHKRPLKQGVYGHSAVVNKRDLTEFQFIDADIVLTCLNKTKYDVNNYFREDIKGIKQLEYPHLNEKIMCCKNNWDECVDDYYLTNGMMGFVDHTYRESYNKRPITIDFRPDFMNKIYKKLPINYYHLNAAPNDPIDVAKDQYSFDLDKFEYSYACTVHKYQGSQANKVLFLYEDFMNSDEDNRRLLYTGITRAIEQIQIIMPN